EAPVLRGEERDPFRADGLHHGPEVVRQILEWRKVLRREAVGQPGAAPVDEDQPRERRELLEEAGIRKELPLPEEVRRVAGEIEQVDRTVADDLVRDIDALGRLRVPGLRSLHRSDPLSRTELRYATTR